MIHKDSIATAMQGTVDNGDLACAATLVWRAGQLLHTAAVGCRDLQTKAPVGRDTLFRIASMTKPITCAAALMLWEEGRFALDDSIASWAPEFSAMRVLRTPTGPLADTDSSERDITFEDLLTHRSGLTYGDFWRGPIADAYAQALGGDIDSAVAPDDWIAALASLPLVGQPGTTFHYGHSTDLLGLLIARLEDAPLGDVLERRIFGPLGMANTSFTVSGTKRDMCASPCGFDDAGRLTARQNGPGGSFMPERPETMTFVSGGQGLWSTVDDYLTFARMFVEGGSVGGVRVLRPETLEMMTANHLTDGQRETATLLGMPVFDRGHGYGMGVAVVLDPEKATPLLCRGGTGTVGWPGGFGGWWQADPTDGSVMILLTHSMVELHQLANGIGLGAYAAIETFHATATAAFQR